MIQAKFGRPCPRIELEPANFTASVVAPLLWDKRLPAGSFQFFADAELSGCDEAERLAIIRRVRYAFADARVQASLKARIKREEAKVEAEAKTTEKRAARRRRRG